MGNEKAGMKREYRGLEENETQEQIREQLKEALRENDQFRRFIGREKVQGWLSSGRPSKFVAVLQNLCCGKSEKENRECIERVLDELLKEYFTKMRFEVEGDLFEFRKWLIEFVEKKARELRELGFEPDVEGAIGEIPNETQNGKKTLEKMLASLDLYYGLIRLTRAGHKIIGTDNTAEKNRLTQSVGEIGETLLTRAFLDRLLDEMEHYYVAPYYKIHKGSKNKELGKQGGSYVDIVVIDAKHKVVGLVEVKNWPGRGLYSRKDYLEKDAEKWKNTEDDIRECSRLIRDGSKLEVGRKKMKGRKRARMPILAEIWSKSERIRGKLGQDLDGVNVSELLELRQLTKNCLKSESGKHYIDVMGEELGVLWALSRRFGGAIDWAEVGNYKFVRFFVTFTGVIKDGKVEGGRRLNNYVLQKFKEDGIVHLVGPALMGIRDRESQEIADLMVWLILELMAGTIEQYNGQIVNSVGVNIFSTEKATRLMCMYARLNGVGVLEVPFQDGFGSG